MDRTQSGDLAESGGDGTLAPSGLASPEPPPSTAPGEAPQPPTAWLAHALIAPARKAAAAGLVYAASSERRADEIGRALRRMAPDVEVLVLPPWDCLPYDRASPSRESMGRRMAVLSRLHQRAESPRVLVASVEALMQRVPPSAAFQSAFLRLCSGAVLDRARLAAFAAETGYVFDDRIDEPGEIAILGSVVDIFPAAAEAPVRISLDDDDRILEIRRYDPLSQRSEEILPEVVVGPASELILPGVEPADRPAGAEHAAAETYGRMDSVLGLLEAASYASDRKAAGRAGDFAEHVIEAYAARQSLADGGAGRIPPPAGLYLTAAEFSSAAGGLKPVELEAAGVTPIPNLALARNPGRAFAELVGERLSAERCVVLVGLSHEIRPLARAIKRGLDRQPQAVDSWESVVAGPAGLFAFEADLEAGFEVAGGLVVIAASDVLGGRVAARRGPGGGILAEPEMRLGDVVIHEDHGLGVLTAVDTVEVEGISREALRLEYHGGASLLVPVDDFGRLWRYGTEPEAVTLDRLHTDAWMRRRAELSAEIDATAEHLVSLARERAEKRAVALSPPPAAYARFAARFAYPETADQAAAIDAVLKDLGSGRPMSRLVCGDVGFGKTEVALRAAAAAALSGRQVAVVAPTTVLARQHFETFRRRFAGFGVEVARLSRLASPAEAREVKAGLADGSIRLVVGTHALAAKDVAFADLGLLIIDEEQRFGAGLKAQLRALSPDAHLLTLTATPIPRTLQMAMVGIEDVSVIATPPARRRPIRTFLAPYDAATVRTALLRERRRGGQSFVVVPRIEDIEGVAAELARLTPELTVRIAHGSLPPQESDAVMVDFAAGDGDVLLATNIIESGLDVPRANTMLVWRADLFGLAQLHQLRGRVGRGRAQGVAYLLHDPDKDLPDATRARLSTLEAFDRLGAGLAISARDLEIRGAGDLTGDEQAGHVKLIGTALYQRLLTRAVQVARGEISGPDWTPELNIGLTGSIPESHVPDPTVRLNLYARLARIAEPEEADALAEELEDRFGPSPEPLADLLELVRLRTLARRAGVVRIDAGPKAVAFTLAPGASLEAAAKASSLVVSKGRLVWRKAVTDETRQLAAIGGLLDRLTQADGPQTRD